MKRFLINTAKPLEIEIGANERNCSELCAYYKAHLNERNCSAFNITLWWVGGEVSRCNQCKEAENLYNVYTNSTKH